MPLSASDISATQRVVSFLTLHPDEIHHPDLQALREFVIHHGGRIQVKKGPTEPPKPQHVDSDPDDERWEADHIDKTFDVAANGASGNEEDEDKAMELKGAAQELASEGQLLEAAKKMTEALRLAPGKAMYWALRADYFLQLKKPNAAIADASRALEINTENARALRVRGAAYRHLGRWEDSAHDLNASQRVDFNEAVETLLKVVQPKANAKRDARRKHELEEQEARQEALRRQRQRELEEEREREEQERARHSGGMPGGFPGGMPGGFPGGMPGGMPGGFPGGMPGGMPGGFPGGMPGGMPGGFPGGMPGAGGAGGMPGMPPGMEKLFSDPEIMAAMQDPEVAPKLAQVMSNPAAAMQMMNDPKMGPLIQKIISKMMGGAGGMPGGHAPRGGAPNPPFGGAPPQPSSASGSHKPSKPAADDLD